MSSKIKVPAILEGVNSLKDGGLSLRFHTQEMSKESMVDAMTMLGGFGWLLFDEQDQGNPVLDSVRKDTQAGKTPSQRLRATLYVLYQQSGQTELTFDQFYYKQMERIINMVKQNLS